MVILIQPISFISGTEEAGQQVGQAAAQFGITKILYGGLFAVWFLAWSVSRIFTTPRSRSLRWHPAAMPAIALGGVLIMAVLVGLIYGSTLKNIVRDLSPYIGYLAVLPVLDAVRKPRQAKNILIILAVIGLPSFLLYEVVSAGQKQGISELSHLQSLPYAAAYWVPFQGAIWAVALAYERIFPRLAAWGWICLSALITVISGIRGPLLSFLASAGIAFLLAGRLGGNKIAKYLIILFLFLIFGGLIADAAGIIKLPISDITRERYSTLLPGGHLSRDWSVEGRINESKALLGGFAKNPIVGVGLGYRLSWRWWDGSLIMNPWFQYHNGYTETLMKFGILGALVFAWYYLTIIRLSLRIIRTGDSFLSRAVGFGMVICLCSGLVSSFAFSAFSDKGFALTAGILTGMLPALAGQNPYEQEAPQQKAAANFAVDRV